MRLTAVANVIKFIMRGLALLLLVSSGAGNNSPPTRAEISDAVQRVLDRTSAQFNMSFQFGSVKPFPTPFFLSKSPPSALEPPIGGVCDREVKQC